MKENRKRAGLALAAAVAALAGCAAPAADTADTATGIAPEEYVREAEAALAAADSFSADFHVRVSMEGGGGNTTSGSVTLVKEPLYLKIDSDIAYDTEDTRTCDIYLEAGADGVSQYMNYDGQWTEMTLSAENAMLGVQIYDTAENMQTILQAAEDWQTTDASNGTLTMTAVIP